MTKLLLQNGNPCSLFKNFRFTEFQCLKDICCERITYLRRDSFQQFASILTLFINGNSKAKCKFRSIFEERVVGRLPP